MTEEKILEWYNNPDGRPIYGFMYGYPFENATRDDLIELSKDDVELTENVLDEPGFYFVWGAPGPSYNFYRFCDYGKTWAFTPEELI